MRKIISLLAVLLLLIGCTPAESSSFIGEKVTDEQGGYMHFELLNGSQDFELELDENADVKVLFENESGSFKVVIVDPKDKEIYSGNMKEAGTFEFGLGIHEGGIYKITVTGDKAKGKIELVKNQEIARFMIHKIITEEIKSLGLKYYIGDEVVSNCHVEEPDGSALVFEELECVLYRNDLPDNCDLDSFSVGFVINGEEVTKAKCPLQLDKEYTFDIVKDKDKLAVWQIVGD